MKEAPVAQTDSPQLPFASIGALLLDDYDLSFALDTKPHIGDGAENLLHAGRIAMFWQEALRDIGLLVEVDDDTAFRPLLANGSRQPAKAVLRHLLCGRYFAHNR
jgi:hypothetical protein